MSRSTMTSAKSQIYSSVILLMLPASLIWAKSLSNLDVQPGRSITGGMSSLASKVIYESPPLTLDRALTEFLVTSRPLNLRKTDAGPKRKKPKKDSKIYFIPIAPMPYRYTPGVGYDYQPMKINPIMMEVSTFKPANVQEDSAMKVKNQVGPTYQYLPPASSTTQGPSAGKKHLKRKNMKDSQIIRINGQDGKSENYFNGKFFKLKVANADPRTTNLTKDTLKSKFYLNENIIH